MEFKFNQTFHQTKKVDKLRTYITSSVHLKIDYVENIKLKTFNDFLNIFKKFIKVFEL